MNLKCYLLVTLLFCTFLSLSAQEKTELKLGKIAPEDFTLSRNNIIDTTAGAIILADVGITKFTGNNQGWFSYIFKRTTKIRIIDKNAFELATVSIELYQKDGQTEKLTDLNAATYNLEGGKVVQTKLNANDIFEVKTDRNHLEKKFALPSVKEGSIVEYSYTIRSDFYFNIPSWSFQHINYPCLWSEYEVTLPSLLIYVVSRQGVHPFFIDKSEEGHQTYSLRQPAEGMGIGEKDYSVSANTIKHKWVIKDIPPIKFEKYLSTPNNYMDKLNFQLSKTYDGESYHDVMNSWAKATTDLLKWEEFGGGLNEDKYWLSEAVNSLMKGNNSSLATAKSIYYYISNNFTCTSYYDKYIKTSLKDVFKKKSGTVGEINLLLIAMLRMAGIHADPVLLSTRDFGFNNPYYPIMERLNYVICKAGIADKTFYLDGSRPYFGFGKLSPDCYNGHARVISNTDSSSFYLSPDSLKEQKVTLVNISNEGKGELTGTFQSVLGEVESQQLREKLRKEDEQEYFKGIKTSFGSEINITNGTIDSLKNVECPLTVNYDFAMGKINEDMIYFNPMLGEGYKLNPFGANEREYPVEMAYTLDNTYIFSMDTPEGYTVDEIPKSIKVSLNNKSEAIFEFLVEKTDTGIRLRSRIKFKRATFFPSEYEGLREFFSSVVKKQNEQIVFKKKK